MLALPLPRSACRRVLVNYKASPTRCSAMPSAGPLHSTASTAAALEEKHTAQRLDKNPQRHRTAAECAESSPHSFWRAAMGRCGGLLELNRCDRLLVYIHGGSLVSGDQYLQVLRESDVVIGGVRYRLNLFGFLALKELSVHDPRPCQATTILATSFALWISCRRRLPHLAVT